MNIGGMNVKEHKYTDAEIKRGLIRFLVASDGDAFRGLLSDRYRYAAFNILVGMGAGGDMRFVSALITRADLFAYLLAESVEQDTVDGYIRAARYAHQLDLEIKRTTNQQPVE